MCNLWRRPLTQRIPKQRKKDNQSVQIVKDHMLLTVKGVQLIKTGVPTKCGGQPEQLCLHFKAKLRPSSTIQG